MNPELKKKIDSGDLSFGYSDSRSQGKVFSASDSIQARGMSVALSCPSCQDARKMDDLHRQQIETLKVDLSTCCDLEQNLMMDIWKLKQSRGWYRMAMCALAAVATYSLAQNDGWIR